MIFLNVIHITNKIVADALIFFNLNVFLQKSQETFEL